MADTERRTKYDIPRTPEEIQMVNQAERAIYHGAKKWSFGAKNLLHNDYDRNRKINYWIIYFRPPESPENLPPAKVGIAYYLETNKFIVTDCPGWSFSYEAVLEVRDVEPNQIASALSVAVFEGPKLEMEGKKKVISSSELPPFVEPEQYPKIWLVTNDEVWKPKAIEALSELRFSSDEILITSPSTETYQQLATVFQKKDFLPEFIGLACPFSQYPDFYQKIAEMFPSSPKVAFLSKSELDNETARVLLARLNPFKFDDVIFTSTDNEELKKCLEFAVNTAPSKWMESLKK